jgi:hypothetical protein
MSADLETLSGGMYIAKLLWLKEITCTVKFTCKINLHQALADRGKFCIFSYKLFVTGFYGSSVLTKQMQYQSGLPEEGSIDKMITDIRQRIPVA